jgi:hypothetical protein
LPISGCNCGPPPFFSTPPPPPLQKRTAPTKGIIDPNTNKRENHRLSMSMSMSSIISSPARGIKTSLEGSCLGRRGILCIYQLDQCSCSRRCVNPAAKNIAFLLARAVWLLSHLLICRPRKLQAAPPLFFTQHDGGWHAIPSIAFSNIDFPI